MNLTKRISTIFIMFLPMLLCAQQYEVTGHVKYLDATPVGFANVFILNALDSTFVKGSAANEKGYFYFKGVKKGAYLLKATYFNSETPLLRLDLKKDRNIETLVLKKAEETLEEVTVSLKRPTVERKADRVVFNVENTIVAQSSSWDIIKSTPGVINSQNTLQIKGQAATIYLNDRKIQLAADEVQSFLEGLSGTNINTIEVIANPPAQYDADGAAIINIVTSKNLVPGYKGSINGNFTQSVFSKYSFGTSHYYKADKLSVFANYTISPRKDLKIVDSEIVFFNPNNTALANWDIDLDKTSKSVAQNGNLILDYEFNDHNNLNFTTNLSVSPNKRIANIVGSKIRNAAGQIDSTLQTNSSILNDNLNLGLDLSYKHQFKKEGKQLTTNIHYTRFTDDATQNVASNYFDVSENLLSNLDFATTANQDIDIYTGQLDFVTPVGKGILGTGGKFSSIRSKNEYDFFDVDGTSTVRNSTLSDNFEYTELIYAGYVSFLRDWEKWVLKLGLRGEQTDVEGRSLVLNTTNTQNYFELFPSFYLLHNLNENNSLSFDYSRKLQRPNYQDLNPFRIFLNENDFGEGNPSLRPNFSHNFNLNYSLKDTYFFDFYYRDNGAYISTLSFQDNLNQTLRQVNQNVNGSISYGLDFTVSSGITDFWYLYAYSSIFSESETFVALESNNQLVENQVNGFYLSVNNYFTLSKDGTLNGEMSLNYLSTFIAGSYVQSNPSTVLNIGLKKSLWKKRASISLVAEDLLGKANPRYTSRYLNQNNSYRPVLETQFIRVGFTYKFGNFKLSDNERELDKKERERLKSE